MKVLSEKGCHLVKLGGGQHQMAPACFALESKNQKRSIEMVVINLRCFAGKHRSTALVLLNGKPKSTLEAAQ